MVRKLTWLTKEARLRIKYMTVGECIFCQIVSGKMKGNKIVETEKVIAFDDINPVSQVHILIVPKRHVESVLTVSKKDAADLVEMVEVAQKLIADKKLEAFRLTFNGGKYQHVPHLHMHLLAGKSITGIRLGP